MKKQDKTETAFSAGRRRFLEISLSAGVFPAVLGMMPAPVHGGSYAHSENRVSKELLEISARYGTPTGKYGRIGDPVIMTIGYQPYCTPYWTSTINKQAQLWKQHLPKGSKVIWYRALSGPLINQNMNAGTNQFGYMAETPALSAGDIVDCDMVSVTGYDNGETGAISVRKDLIDSGQFAAPADLEGKLVGAPFGSYSHRQILTWAYQNGVEMDLKSQSIEKQMSLLNRQVSWAGASWEPYPSWMEQRNVAMRWKTGQDMSCTCSKYNDEAIEHSFRVTGSTLAIHDWLRERPDIIVGYLKSEENCRDMLTNDPDLAAYYIWSDISEVPPAVVRSTLDMMIWDGRITPAVNAHLKGCARMWREEGLLKSQRSSDPDRYVDEWASGSFLDRAIEELRAEGVWTSAELPGFPRMHRQSQNERHDWRDYQGIKLRSRQWKPTSVVG